MREGYLHIRFADAFNLYMGKTPDRDNSEYWKDGIHPWVAIADMKGGKYITDTKEKLPQIAVDNTKIHCVKEGTVIMSFKLSIGKTAIAPFDLYTNEAIMAFEPKEGVEVLPDWLYYYLPHYQWNANKAVKGTTINKNIISNAYIDIPPFSTQELIVRELDSISSVISAKKQQVLELDNLAQAIFLDMFGDPITNPKGWEVKKMSEVGLVKIGPFGSLLHKSDYVSGGIPLVNPVHMKGGYIQADMDFTITTDKAKELSNYRMQPNDFVFARRGDIGRCAIVSAEQDGYLCGTGSLFVRLTDAVNSTFMLYVTRSKSFVSCLNDKAKGATMQNINCGIVENLPIPLPPLSLQQAFAEKVQAIEEQKRLINQSIAEFESLLAQRMEFHFA